MRQLFKSYPLFAIVAVLLLALTNCDDEGTIGPDVEDPGFVSFSVAGDLEAEKEGIAEFALFAESNVEQWDLLFNDIGPQTYSLVLMTHGEDLERPSEGVYTIGNDLSAQDEFFAVFEDLEEGFDSSVEYTTTHDDAGGELEITESTDDIVRGSFSFTAIKTDQETGEVIGEITITEGDFSATRLLN